ncbi:FliH/SctL family protein [Reinekea marina]|uniref:Flagellar assembly protein FliH n=1 Tax=Reinekea marina TaxID=1310421 RepID=A0ABV7WQX8_9GAMM|nr:FliH/SctL family protein [Reinekea marina]MDN3649362.1 FliH/SctL family protein [Reinekea marina]
MSTTKKKVMRDASGVSELNLPKWDKNGNAVQSPEPKKPTAKVIPTVTPDIEEESISAPTVKELEKIREDAYNEGFEQGYEQGLKQGNTEGHTQGLEKGLEEGKEKGLAEGRETGHAQALAEGKAETAKALEVFKSISSALQEYRTEDELEIEKALGVLAVKIARQVVQDELRTKPSHIKQVVHAAVQALPNPDEKLTLRINPVDLEFVKSTAETNWQLQSDEAIRSGGCTVKSGFSYVDYTLEHRFETAVKQLINHIEVDVPEQKISQPISDDYLLDNTLPEVAAVDEAETQDVDIGDEQLDYSSDTKMEPKNEANAPESSGESGETENEQYSASPDINTDSETTAPVESSTDKELDDTADGPVETGLSPQESDDHEP